MKTFDTLITELQAEYGMADWVWYMVIVAMPVVFLGAIFYLPKK